MGKSKKQTIGYWYLMLIHFGWCRGPIDAFLEFRGGDKTAWKGELTESGTISIAARDLWGGEKQEGGIEGDFDVMFGEPDQEPNSYLAANLDPQQSAYRGRAGGVFKGGRYGAFNPYPKPASFKLRRILKGWDNDECWYPETASISPIDPSAELVVLGAQMSDWRHLQIGRLDATDCSATAFDDSAWPTGTAPFGGWEAGYGSSEIALGAPSGNNPAAAYDPRFTATFGTTWNANTRLWLRRTLTLSGLPTGLDFVMYIEDNCTLWVNGNLIIATPENPSFNGRTFHVADHHLVLGANIIAVRCDDEAPASGFSGVYFDMAVSATSVLLGGSFMNPAHMLYQSITSQVMQGEPVDLINDANFREAADIFYGEGFGLCTQYDPSSESVEDFQQRICNIAGCALSQSRVDGKYYLTVIRGSYDIESLPILSDDDILEYSEEPTDPLESVNQVIVEWFDPATKQKRSTAPLQSLGAIQAAGGILSEVLQYPEIPYESLALRVGARDLQQKSTPLKRFNLTTNRVPYAWRGGQFFRLQAPRRGIADMVCLVGEIDAGTLRSGTMRLVSIQDVSGMPASTYVAPQPGVDPGSQVPIAPPAALAFETPYVELAGRLSAAELSALETDTGFLAVVAQRPTVGRNYELLAGADGADLDDAGIGDWCPSASVVEVASKSATDFTLAGGTDLSRVSVGSAALWDDEIVRIDALNVTTGAVTFGRACADTVPATHAAGARIWFYDEWASSDELEYVDGELVHAKTLTRTSSQKLAAADAPDLTVTMDSRQARPYPPGRPTINAVAFPASVAVADPMTIAWTHRDRILQANTLIDTTEASVGPESSVRYALRFLRADTNALLVEKLDLAGPTASVSLAYAGNVVMQLYAISDNGDSWQMHSHTFAHPNAAAGSTITGTTYVYTPPTWTIDGNGG